MSLVDQDVTYTFTAAPGECVTSPTYQAVIHVNSLQTPHFAALQNLSYCEGTAPVAVLSTSSDEGYIGTWTPSQIDNTQTRNYVFHPAANQCASDVTINVRIDPKLTPHFDPIAPFCAGSVAPALPPSSNDTPPVTGTWSPPTIDNDAVGTLPYHFTPDPGQCYKEIDLNVTVTAPEDPGFDNIVFCENAVPVPALPTVSPKGYAGTWNPAAIDPANIADEYIFTPDAGQCANPQSIQVTENLLTLTDATWTVSNFFEDGTIEILAVDAGNYLYQLNSGPLQESSVFTHVPPGVYSFTVYDANGCADPITKVDVVRIIGYPKFFTPNGDGNNDTWNIADLRNVGQSQAPIRIFDRYGKLLKQISAGGEGWDGTYNGQPLPSTDYWFVVQYEENGQQLEFKAHFALKR
jgi:gliding motility-associated-like protein